MGARYARRGALLVAGWALLVSGCGGGAPAPTKVDFVGVWQGADGGTLDLAGDGQFTAEGVPPELFSQDAPRRPTDGAGTWEFVPTGSPPKVELVFEPAPDKPRGFRTRVSVEGRGKQLTLYLNLDDEGFSRYEFTKR